MWYLWAIQCRGKSDNCRRVTLTDLALDAFVNRVHMDGMSHHKGRDPS
jgi:hypothetical protein